MRKRIENNAVSHNVTYNVSNFKHCFTAEMKTFSFKLKTYAVYNSNI